ncbi:NUDIX hydrolase [Renibacterium salmoninarum ATCC 33209]|uniref:Oxidized purine nucleoside triphosphate hydrolase n=1 Tax=Renibacterium salmoninarum (strain ATCC 33209 / DSM 20767 / JCM 11484 / NBRC 15589 / NCIMB 2235) TaxID=288705 RepID=A9WQJ3_RENSM|nr:8-oxo-dGTP diphosphatase [Renibacterium salmoninarum]ABY22563.1 NUDIX hydrolase [Renibacterium salmoninarum ATCC 33209]
MTPAPVTLLFLLRTQESGAQEVLLGLKKTGFGTGKIVGIGGHVEPGESAIEAAVREIAEETSIDVLPADLAYRGSVAFRFPAHADWDMDAEVFIALDWTGEARESEEIAPQWYAVDALPAAQMWEDAGHWLPGLLSGPVQHFAVQLAADNQAVERVTSTPG